MKILWPDTHATLTKSMGIALDQLGYELQVPSNEYKISHKPPPNVSQFVWNTSWTQEKVNSDFKSKNVTVVNKEQILDSPPDVIFVTSFENQFEILSFNIQLIIIYFWTLKRPSVLGNGHIFFAGLINDVVTGVPLGLSSLSYLIVSLIATYIKNMTVNTTIASDWFTFFIALIFANLLFFLLVNNFSNVTISYVKIGYNTFFTLFLFPILWLLFSLYQANFIGGQDA